MKKIALAGMVLAFMLAGCGGGGGGATPASTSTQSGATPPVAPTTQTQSGSQPVLNQVEVDVNGAQPFNAPNAPMVSITICQPGTQICATIPNVLVDSGSSGLVLMASAVPASLNLPNETVQSTGGIIGACTVYGGGPTWGPVATADVRMGGEVASAVPVELAGGTSIGSGPGDCADTGALNSMAANGILGIAGDYGLTSTDYYDCSTPGCAAAAAIRSSQALTGVIGRFASDNNGVILSFPSVAATGAAAVTGTMTFGLNTQADNSTANVAMSEGISNYGMSTQYNGTTMKAILDSGSSVGFFASTSLPTCTVSNEPGMTWLCPSSPTAQSAAFQYPGGTPLTVPFEVGNAQTLLQGEGVNWAIPGLAVESELLDDAYLDIGMPFMFGRALYLGYPVNGAAAPTIGFASS